MEGILDESRLNGVYDVGTALRPLRHADLVPADDMGALLAKIEWHCQVWGGGGSVLVPSVNGTIDQAYEWELVRSDVDALDVRLMGGSAVVPQWIGSRLGQPYPALLVADGRKDRKDWLPFRVADLRADDPWKPIYAATIGLWPAVPSRDLFPSYAFDGPPDSFEMFFKVERQTVEGSMDDLIERLTGRNTSWPRTLSLLGLASGARPSNGYVAGDRFIPWPDETKVAAGPNVLVVFGDDSVADAALLWNLRAAHARGYAMPMGIPQAELDKKSVAKVGEPGMFAAFGLSGGRTYLTSASVPIEEVAAFAELHPGLAAAPYNALLSFGRAPSLAHNQVAAFSDGRARLVPETEADLSLIHPHGDIDWPDASTRRGRRPRPRANLPHAQGAALGPDSLLATHRFRSPARDANVRLLSSGRPLG